MGKAKHTKLKKSLGLFDLFAISTGAMFSSGFFLLPGLAYAQAGPAVVLAYLLSGLLMLPAMFSIAELATALPRAGGSYYFIDRSLGPLAGNLGGFGVYTSLVLKTSFTLVGMGAYSCLFLDLPVKVVALSLAIVFMFLNLFGAKHSSGLQKILVVTLIVILAFFMIQGFVYIFGDMGTTRLQDTYTPLLPYGPMGLLTTIGFVFISYAGLTKIESVAEEVKNPERNIPLGMILSLMATMVIYTLGVFVVVAVLDHTALVEDMTPIATAGDAFMSWLPGESGLLILVIAAFAAFASTGNAGIMSASRYPLAMARDRLLPPAFARINRFYTPGISIITTSAIVAVFILLFTASEIAKMASTVHLVIMLLLNVSVIVMRKSEIPSYDPGFRSPMFPYIQYFGISVYGVLIIYMGALPLVLGAGVFLLAHLWYKYYGRKNTRREGAIFHWFARMGKYQDPGLEWEFIELLKEKGLREDDPFDHLIIETNILIKNHLFDNFDRLLTQVSKSFSRELGQQPGRIEAAFREKSPIDPSLLYPQVSLLHAQLEQMQTPRLKIVLSKKGIKRSVEKGGIHSTDTIHVFFFLVSPAGDQRQHLRLLVRISDILERENFVEKMLECRDEQRVKEYLLHHERYISLDLVSGSPAEAFIGQNTGELDLPADTLPVLIRRKTRVFTPDSHTTLKENDSLTIIGDPKSIDQLYKKYK
ncbi:MAG: amino acid permease [Bacteroidales bacterium]